MIVSGTLYKPPLEDTFSASTLLQPDHCSHTVPFHTNAEAINSEAKQSGYIFSSSRKQRNP